MKHKSIQSQTTQRLYQHPPAPTRIPMWEHFVANLLDALKLLTFLGVGLVLWYLLTFFIHSLFFGG